MIYMTSGSSQALGMTAASFPELKLYDSVSLTLDLLATQLIWWLEPSLERTLCSRNLDSECTVHAMVIFQASDSSWLSHSSNLQLILTCTSTTTSHWREQILYFKPNSASPSHPVPQLFPLLLCFVSQRQSFNFPSSSAPNCHNQME